MRKRQEIMKMQIDGWERNDQSIHELLLIGLLMDIRDLLANPPEENVKQEVRCKECQNDNHGGCTGCTCHADY